MKQIPLIALIAVLITLPGCYTAYRSTTHRDDRTISRTTTTGEISGRPTLGMPISLPGKTTVLIPFAVESRKGVFEADDPFRASGLQSYDMTVAKSAGIMQPATGGASRWHNAVLRDLKTNEEWTILKQRGVISQWRMMFVPPKKDELPVCRALLFVAVVEDTNKDGELNDRDCSVAILTDADGRNPREVTPRDGQVWDVRHDPSNDAAYLRVVKDTNGDGTITLDDAPVPYFLPLGANRAEPLTDGSRRAVEGMLK